MNLPKKSHTKKNLALNHLLGTIHYVMMNITFAIIYFTNANTTVPLTNAVTGIAIIVKGRGRRDKSRLNYSSCVFCLAPGLVELSIYTLRVLALPCQNFELCAYLADKADCFL